jgi:hypothetical protein
MSRQKVERQAAKWINSHHGRPSVATKLGKNDKTTEIMKADIKALMENKSLWAKYKKLFRKIPGDDTDIEQFHRLSDEERKFMNNMRSPWVKMRNVYLDPDILDSVMKPATGFSGGIMYKFADENEEYATNNDNTQVVNMNDESDHNENNREDSSNISSGNSHSDESELSINLNEPTLTENV